MAVRIDHNGKVPEKGKLYIFKAKPCLLKKKRAVMKKQCVFFSVCEKA